MKNARPQWYEELKQPPFDRNMFTPEMEKHVLQGWQKQRNLPRLPRRLKVYGLIGTAVVLAAALLLMSVKLSPQQSPWNLASRGSGEGTAKGTWEPHSAYVKGKKTLIEAIPGDDYEAGRASGCYWILEMPYDELQNSSVRITATNRDTGFTLTELPDTQIDRTMGLKDSIRLGSKFGMPYAGMWRFDVFIDGQKKGDVVFDIPDSNWEIAPDFDLNNTTVTGDIMSMGYVSSGFTAGQPNKFLWHFFAGGELKGPLRVDAVKQGTQDVRSILESNLGGEYFNKTLPSTMELPEAGLWRLLVYVNDQFYDSMIVKVKP